MNNLFVIFVSIEIFNLDKKLVYQIFVRPSIGCKMGRRKLYEKKIKIIITIFNNIHAAYFK